MQQSTEQHSARPVAIWLLVGVGMIIIQILLGGITRLTGSGLSITEWDVITGMLPPMSEANWITEFDKYKQTPQYQLLNMDFSLRDFKFIFFWEWLHRFWARLIGLVFLVPFIIFLIQKRFRPSMIKPMIVLFLLGALQGFVGWIMVASGLTGDAIYVKPARLALHFIFALGLLGFTFWFALNWLVPAGQQLDDPKSRRLTLLTIAALVLQLIYGALMAGHKAAASAPTWPDINGYTIPPNMMGNNEGLLNLIDNKITIHFIHRGLAYILVALIVLLTYRLYKITPSRILQKSRRWPMILILVQVALGIASVLSSVKIIPNRWGAFEWMAQLHQLTAMLLLLSLVWVYYMVRGNNRFTTV
jgi:cytochrome c oxidase assembly protein subunit 15